MNDDVVTIARRMRRLVLEMSHRAGTPHLGSSLSCVELLAAVYHSWNVRPESWPNPQRDRVLLSKGHAGTTLYAALRTFGFLTDDDLATYAQPGSLLGEHPSPGLPGIEIASGSLGHGLNLAIGLALAARLQGWPSRIGVILSDGECNEGTVWEAALFAPRHRLANLFALIDYNKWQATGRSDEVTALAPLAEKWRAFGWAVHEVDGHDLSAIQTALSTPDADGRPTMIVAHTVKGKGVSFMEDDNNWHYRVPNAEELARALTEVGIP
ncbi:MAG TPA: transketolase [Planctomycetaceae bacterium]|nr:transketolase [Planctomycetaceae bacterium]